MAENDEEIIDDGQHLHSNWRALATAHIKHKIFVKSSGTEDERIAKNIKSTEKIEIGESVSEFYQEVLSMPSTSSLDSEIPRKSNYTRQKKIKKPQKVPFNKENLFRLALNNDSEGIEKLLENSLEIDINAADNFGWTALMMSACEGSEESFRTLLFNHNADLDVKDKSGNTALSLARKNNRQGILNIIQEYHSSNNYDESSEEDEEVEEGSKFCPDCKIEIAKSSSKSHQSSTVHLFSCKYKTETDIKSFGIGHSNKGYKLMKTIGWDGNSALGPKKDGKIYPVKTVMRKGRTGLGVKQNDPKITHFKSYDVRAVHHNSQPRALTRKEILEQSLKDKRREQMLRRELS